MDPCFLIFAGGVTLLGLHVRQVRHRISDQRDILSITEQWSRQTRGQKTFAGHPFSLEVRSREQVRLTVHLRLICPASVQASATLVPHGHVLLYPDHPGPRVTLLAPRDHAAQILALLDRDPALADDLASLLEHHGVLSARRLGITLQPLPADIRPHLENLTAISTRLEAAWTIPWRQLADTLGLALALAGDHWCLQDPARQLQVEIYADHLHLWARIPALAGLTITHPDDTASDPRLRTSNPVLDQLLVVRGPAPAPVWLQDPEISAALLALLHPHPGAGLADNGTLRVTLPDPLDTEALTLAVRDVQRLQAGGASGSPGG